MYGIESLQMGVFLLRRAGYNIHTETKRDDFGRKYGKYTLVKSVH